VLPSSKVACDAQTCCHGAREDAWIANNGATKKRRAESSILQRVVQEVAERNPNECQVHSRSVAGHGMQGIFIAKVSPDCSVWVQTGCYLIAVKERASKLRNSGQARELLFWNFSTQTDAWVSNLTRCRSLFQLYGE
jgi:hypothetical protein